MADFSTVLGSSNSDWINRWRALNNYNGKLDPMSFDTNLMRYSPEEYQRANIGLIPVAGRTIKWQPQQWQVALEKARLQMQLEQSQAQAQGNAQAESDAAQTQIQTEADKAAEVVRANARRAVNRKTTILTAPISLSPVRASSATYGNPMKTVLGG